MTSDIEIETFLRNPVDYFGRSPLRMHTVDRSELESLQLAGLRHRFASLRERIPVLTMMAGEQGVGDLIGLDDVVPLLFRHTMYKSYPSSLLLKGRFDLLTRWLDRLTAVDLSGVDVSAVDSIDGWLGVLDEATSLRVVHTSGTTGTMSFLPHTVRDFDVLFQGLRHDVLGGPDGTPAADGDYCDVVWPTFRSGRSGMVRCTDFLIQHLAGSAERFHSASDGHISADVVYFSSRITAAQSRGEALDLGPSLQRRAAEFDAIRRDLAESLPRFFERCIDHLVGKRVYSIGLWSVYHEIAAAGLGRGLENCFAPTSSIWPGGGQKGAALPEGWEDTVCRFFGVPELQHMYAMSEVMAFHRLCAAERYHIQPWVILHVLDPDTGQVQPRTGTRTGRAAFFDLLPDTYWGGFMSGDEITVDWDQCRCGRTTPGVWRTISRFSETRDGDDKVTCVASEDAHRNALDMLTGLLG